MRLTTEELDPYFDHLRHLPFVDAVEVLHLPNDRADRFGFDALIRVETPHRRQEFLVEIKRANLTRPLVNGLLSQATTADRPWILFAPYVGRPMGELLARNGANYVDVAGNCHLRIHDEHIAHIQGKRRPRRKGSGRGIGVAGYKALFAILACPELLNEPVRVLAGNADIGKTAAAEAIERLLGEGLIGGAAKHRRVLERRTLMDRWLSGYATLLRPRLLIGSFRTPDETPATLEKRIQSTLGKDLAWVWGGGAAAMRLTGHYRGDTTTIHVAEWTSVKSKSLRALPAENGTLTILLAPGKSAFEGANRQTAHPLLVYTELLAMGNARAREAAEEIRVKYLKGME